MLIEILQARGLVEKTTPVSVIKTVSAGSTESGSVSPPSGRGYLFEKITFSKCRDTAGNQITTDELFVEFVHKRMVAPRIVESFKIYAVESVYDYEHALFLLLSRDDELQYRFVNESASDLVWGFTLHVYSYPVRAEGEILKILQNPFELLLPILTPQLRKLIVEITKKTVPEVVVERVERVEKKPRITPVEVKEVPIKGIGIGNEI